MAREARDIAVDLKFSVVFVARNKDDAAALKDNDDVILESDVERFTDMPYVIGIGECAIRHGIAKRFADKITFTNLIHPAATFGKGQRHQVESRKGVIICAGVRLTSNIIIGDFVILNLNSTISHDTILGDFVTVCPHACVLGNVEVKSGAWIGAGAVVNQGNVKNKTTIGKNTTIGSGAVVVEDCKPNSVYIGVPARMMK
jgi:sugar O-acyltransferase (sialic acid O-acetyltransferase NeuD family)